jgi:hypothetical protein
MGKLCGKLQQPARENDGNRCYWQPHQRVEEGGRPVGGNLDGSGFTECPYCGRNYYVQVFVRDDLITQVVPDPLKNKPVFHPNDFPPAEPLDLSQPDKEKGKITFQFSETWLTERRKTALARLAELGVDVYPIHPIKSDYDFRLMIPHRLHTRDYIEIAFLMAEIADTQFHRPPIDYVESYPHGTKFRIRPQSEA